jgi:nickel-dependent lactate racemase
MAKGKGYTHRLLTESEVRDLMDEVLASVELTGRRVLILIPDGTRSGPIHLFFRLFHELLWGRVSALDYLIALGTHQPMAHEAILRHLGITSDEMGGRYAGVGVFNHQWENPEILRTVGTIPTSDIEELSRGLLSEPLPVTLNRVIFDYDWLVVCGPVFPHEVVGISGGNKYFFPGISGSEVINFTHWLGALITSSEIIGTKDTPVRSVIDRAASFIEVPKLSFCWVVKEGGLAGLYAGTPEEAWSQAADLSAGVHTVYMDRSYHQVLSMVPEIYDDLWTAAKGMYKVEPIVADGGEVIVCAPHINEVSYTHGHVLDEIGYHVRDYFVKQWEDFRHYPWGVLAHSTHFRGNGTYEDGVEKPRIQVTLASGIPRERCERLRLGYRDPSSIDPTQWANRENEGVLLVPRAGETLYRRRKPGENEMDHATTKTG